MRALFATAVALAAVCAVFFWGLLSLLSGHSGALIAVLSVFVFVTVTSGVVVVGSIRLAFRRYTEFTAVQFDNLRALINLRPLFGPLPAQLDGWAAELDFGELVATTIINYRPRVIVECGSGNSTALIASCLREIGHGSFISLDHEADFAARTRLMLEARGLQEFAEVRHTPLTRNAGDSALWYDVELQALPGPIDLLVIDGPPATSDPLARLPALRRLQSKLSNECVVLLDDGNRPGEREIVRQWNSEFGGALRYISTQRGAWQLTLNGDHPPP